MLSVISRLKKFKQTLNKTSVQTGV